MSILALDFETANETRASACALGLAWIEGTTVGKTDYRLIRPDPLRFQGMNVAIHGILPEHVADQPEFPTVWDASVGNMPLSLVLAHNAAFDMSVLRASFDLYGLSWPTFSYLCTVKVARAVWPDLPDHRLSTVARHLDVTLTHHHAGSDALACARIALLAMQQMGCADLASLAKDLNITLGTIGPHGYIPCRGGARRFRR